VGTSILAIIGSMLVGGVVATVTVVGLVHAQTSPSGNSPTNVKNPVAVQYGASAGN
jgi:hypothetical protein